jgi:hypothetical protein
VKVCADDEIAIAANKAMPRPKLLLVGRFTVDPPFAPASLPVEQKAVDITVTATVSAGNLGPVTYREGKSTVAVPCWVSESRNHSGSLSNEAARSARAGEVEPCNLALAIY